MLRDGNRGLQAQLKDTVEAVQVASELPFRLKEAEEPAINEQKQIMMTEPKADPMNADSNIDDKTKVIMPRKSSKHITGDIGMQSVKPRTSLYQLQIARSTSNLAQLHISELTKMRSNEHTPDNSSENPF
ncbi:hypothetical protein KIW84_033211 [Lathyrus oleraceus]|uniref:Uncharacterized protein n=1 Tax=Pisum sativum TaxID=3888 RepID=A0A9D4Y021_PEA|nr:hypothetical protein KIW84_033211 [Pisum sativum]